MNVAKKTSGLRILFFILLKNNKISGRKSIKNHMINTPFLDLFLFKILFFKKVDYS
jgi:hypothetical protein